MISFIEGKKGANLITFYCHLLKRNTVHKLHNTKYRTIALMKWTFKCYLKKIGICDLFQCITYQKIMTVQGVIEFSKT